MTCWSSVTGYFGNKWLGYFKLQGEAEIYTSNYLHGIVDKVNQNLHGPEDDIIVIIMKLFIKILQWIMHTR